MNFKLFYAYLPLYHCQENGVELLSFPALVVSYDRSKPFRINPFLFIFLSFFVCLLLKIILFIYLFLAVLGLHCCLSFAVVAVSGSDNLVASDGLLTAVVSLDAEQGSRAQALLSRPTDLVALQHVGSF